MLLDRAGLPTADLTDEHMRNFFYAGEAQAPIGVVGFELYAPDALLRSLVVAPAGRSFGVGTVLVYQVEVEAQAQGVRSMFLLTTTAEGFFRKLGYERLPREAAPAAIGSTSEFSNLCPASSAFMVKHLSP